MPETPVRDHLLRDFLGALKAGTSTTVEMPIEEMRSIVSELLERRALSMHAGGPAKLKGYVVGHIEPVADWTELRLWDAEIRSLAEAESRVRWRWGDIQNGDHAPRPYRVYGLLEIDVIPTCVTCGGTGSVDIPVTHG